VYCRFRLNMSNEPDLSGFPVLRIDQISAVDNDTLAAAHKEAKELIQSLLSESQEPIPPMVRYLRKQNDAVSAELMNRLAQDRINALLSGATSLLNNDRSRYIVSEDDDDLASTSVSTVTQKSGNGTAAIAAPPPAPSPAFQPVPLPSERRKRQSSTDASDGGQQSLRSSTVPSLQEAALATSKSPLRRSESSPVGIAMSSRSTTEREKPSFGADDEGTTADDDNSQQAGRRPLSGDLRISRRNQEYINRNFGNTFIVAGEGRRRRPMPAKKPVESVETVKARERLDRSHQCIARTNCNSLTVVCHLARFRRKAAMQRLLERKEQRLQQQMVCFHSFVSSVLCSGALAWKSCS
jgi:hypothetical protein